MKIVSKKLFMFFLISVLSFTYFSPVLAANEDFTTYTEVDTSSKVTISNSTVAWYNELLSSVAYVYIDKGVNYFDGSFQINFTANVSQSTSGAGGTSFWATSNSVGTRKNMIDASADYLAFSQNNPSSPNEIRWHLRENANGSEYDTSSTSYFVPTLNTSYYISLIRDEAIGSYGRLTAYIYSDEAKTTLVGSIYLDLHKKTDFRYNYGHLSYGITGSYPMGGSTANMSLSSAVAPTVTTGEETGIAYSEVYDSYITTLHANVTDDGGEEVSGGFYFKDALDSEWSWANALGTYATSENFSVELFNLELGHTYQYYAYALNSAGSDTGSTDNFTVSVANDVPTMTTLAYPFSFNRDTQTATLYGQVTWNGNSSVTGWMQYKESDNVTWNNSSSNVTSLTTSDVFSINITPLNLYTYYDFRAVGLNNEGIGYGNSSSFYIGDNITAPTMITDNVTSITDTTARLYGTVSDNGSSSVFAYFQYRRIGTNTWSQTAGAYIMGSYHWTISGLSPATNYEYRAVGWNYDPANYNRNYAYGNIKTFATYTSVSIPIINTGNITYISSGTVAIYGTVMYDGGSPVSLYFQVRENGFTDWIETDYRLEGYTTGQQGLWYISNLVDNHTYQARALGTNYVGTGYGNIVTFVMSPTLDISGSTGGTDVDETIQGFSALVNQIRLNFGMTGAMGIWAFMGLILLLVAFLFGTAFFVTNNPMGKTAIGTMWLLSSIAVVGGFIFTGQLGIWPILILVGGVVALILTIISIKLSGNKEVV